jgi:thioesterase domain-containing protein
MQERGPAVVSFNERGGETPVVFLHTWATDRDRLASLAEFLGSDQPLYGIEPPPTDALPVDVEGWVAFDRHHLETLPITPPYRLAGFSFGGVVALELARELEADDQPVEWIGLVDTLRPKLNPKGARRYLRYHLQEYLDLADRKQRRHYAWHLARGGAYRNVLRVKNKSIGLLARLHVVRRRPKSLGDERHLLPLKRSIWRSYLGYEPRPYERPVALFTGTENRAAAAGDISLRWSRYLRGGFEVVEVEGAHLELFLPEHIHSVGGAIRDSLARCQGINSTRPNASRLSR